MHIDHVTIRTRNLSAARDFFMRVFGLEEKPRPKTIQHIPGHWLYADDRPIVHLIDSVGFGSDRPAEAIDHVGFRLDGYTAFRRKLEGLDIPHTLMDMPELNERRIFLRSPGGPLLETIFAAADVGGTSDTSL